MRMSDGDVETWEAKQPEVTLVSSLQPTSLQWKAVSSQDYVGLKDVSNAYFKVLSHVLCALPSVSGSATVRPLLETTAVCEHLIFHSDH